MDYAFPITVSADTAEDSPVEEILKITEGVVVQVSIQFPAGCQGMVYLAILRGDHQVWPLNRDEAFNGEDVTIIFPEHYQIDDHPLYFVARAWSPGTSYDHEVTVRLDVLRPDEVSQWPDLMAKFDKFFQMLGVT